MTLEYFICKRDGMVNRECCQPCDCETQAAARAAKCEHAPMKAALDSTVWCIRCAAHLGEAQ